VREHVARAGFSPEPRAKAKGLAGVEWRGRVLQGSDRLTPGEVHYLRHVVVGQEWPATTTFEEYLQSLRDVILDDRGGVLTSRYRGAWQLAAVGRSPAPPAPEEFPWVLVEYRLGLGHWVTAYRPTEGLRVLDDPNREELRWLRRP